MDDRVWVGTCAGPRDVMLVRSLFSAHDIPLVISGEHHFTLYPWYVGAYRTDVFVGAADAEDAAALLAGSRSGEHTVLDNFDSAASATEHRADTSSSSGVPPLGAPLHPWSVVPTDRWHQAGMALLFGMIAGFGAAHFYYTRAWVRGLALAIIQLGVTRVLDGQMDVLDLVILARVADVVGALWLFWYGRDDQVAFRWRRLEPAGPEPDGTSAQEGTPSP